MLSDAEARAVAAAVAVRRHAHAPVSGIGVGAALVGRDGTIYAACNYEVSVFQSLCAERNALGTAISEGERRFKALAVASDREPPLAPCGLCRQALSDFEEDLAVIIANADGTSTTVTTLAALLPSAPGKAAGRVPAAHRHGDEDGAEASAVARTDGAAG